MENATKALLIAGGVLITVLLLTFMAFTFKNMALDSSNIYENLEESEVNEFNQKFLNYEGRDNLTIQDVVTIIHLSQDNENTGKMPTKVIVKLNDIEVQGNKEEEINKMLENYIGKEYECTQITIGTNTKLVEEVIIKDIDSE